MQRYMLTIAYDGTDFHGWQKQSGNSGGVEAMRTVSGELEKALQRVLRQPIDLVGASRTDAGVHAKGQVAHFDVTSCIAIEKLLQALNSRLAEDVDIRVVKPADAEFNAIKDAVRKQYRYRIFNSQQRPMTRRHYVWHCWKELDVDRMSRAAARLVGTHDFEGFSAANHGRASTVRTIFDCHIETKAPEIQVVVVGDGFLYNMVRIIVGTLIEVGRGRFDVGQIDKIINSCNRRDAGPTLAPHGLCLEWIRYD